MSTGQSQFGGSPIASKASNRYGSLVSGVPNSMGPVGRTKSFRPAKTVGPSLLLETSARS